jgi:dihydroorotate dehydrogenase
MADLRVTFGGLDFKNPIMIAALAPGAPWTHWPQEKDASEIQMKMWRKYYQAGVGSITTGTIFFRDLPDGRGARRLFPIRTKGFAEREGFVGASTIPDALLGRTQGMRALQKAKKEFMDIRVIASIMGPGADIEAWGSLALEAEQAGADMLELNLASVMFIDTAEQALAGIELKEKLVEGVTVGLMPQVVTALVKGIKKVCRLPLIPKITPEMGFFRLLAAIRLYKEAGITALTCDHAVMTVPPPDIYNGGKTVIPFLNKTTWWNPVGGWNRFLTYRDVPLVAKYSDIDVAACGGLVIPEHCIEVMMLGAKMVQLSAGILWNGLSHPAKVLGFIKKYMEDQGYNSVNDFIGLGLKYLVEMGEAQKEFKEQFDRLKVDVDYDKCLGPETCNICLDTFCTAIYEEGGMIKLIPDYCSGSLCYKVPCEGKKAKMDR